MRFNWHKHKSKIPIAIVGFLIVFYFALFKRSAVNGLPIFAEENVRFVSIGTALMIVVVFIINFITNIYDNWNDKKSREVRKYKKKNN